MNIDSYLMQTIEMPIVFPITCFICGCFFYFIFDGLSGIIHLIIEKAIAKIKEKKELNKKDV